MGKKTDGDGGHVTVCLNMIVKDESKVIRECLEQMLPYITCYCIVDTGSTDETPTIIREYFLQKGIPGKVICHNFKTCNCHPELERTDYFDFGKNRSYAIEQCYGMSDFIFLMDADDRINGKLELDLSSGADTYNLKLGTPGFTYWRPLIFRNDPRFGYHFNCPLHEYLTAKRPTKTTNLEGNYCIESGRSGARSQDPQKYQKDARVFEEVMTKEPDSPDFYRYVFYCAQSWKDAGEREKAIKYYRQRANWTQGWAEERFYSYYQIGLLMKQGHYSPEELEQVCLDGIACNSQRAECHHLLAEHYYERDQLTEAEKWSSEGLARPYPPNGLFVYKNIYEIELPWLAAQIAEKQGNVKRAQYYYREVKERLTGIRLEQAERFLEKHTEKPNCAVIVEIEDLSEIGSEKLLKSLGLLQKHYHLTLFSDYSELPYRTYPLTQVLSKLDKVSFDLILFSQLVVRRELFHTLVSSSVHHLYQPVLGVVKNAQTVLKYRCIKAPEPVINGETLAIPAGLTERNDTGPADLQLSSYVRHLKKDQLILPKSISALEPAEQVTFLEKLTGHEGVDYLLGELYLKLGKWDELEQLYREVKGDIREFDSPVESGQNFDPTIDSKITFLYAQGLLKQGRETVQREPTTIGSSKVLEGYRLLGQLLRRWGRQGEYDFVEAEKVRDSVITEVMKVSEKYPQEIIERLTYQKNELKLGSGSSNPKIIFTITTCKRFDLFSKTINSFLNCCEDLELVTLWYCVDDNSSDEDRRRMIEQYPFFEYHFKTPEMKGHSKSMNLIFEKVINGNYDYHLHLEDDWHYVERRPYLSDCLKVLESDTSLLQVLHNRNTMEIPNYLMLIKGGRVFQEPVPYVRHEHFKPGGYPSVLHSQKTESKREPEGNILYWPNYSFRPGLSRVSGLRKIGRFSTDGFFEYDYAYEAASLGYRLAMLDSFCCYHLGRKTWEKSDSTAVNAYTLNQVEQFGLTKEEVKLIAVTTRQSTEQWVRFKENHQNLVYSVFRPEFRPLPLEKVHQLFNRSPEKKEDIYARHSEDLVAETILYNKRAALEQFLEKYRPNKDQPAKLICWCQDHLRLSSSTWKEWLTKNPVFQSLPVNSVLIRSATATGSTEDLVDQGWLIFRLDHTATLSKIERIEYSCKQFPLDKLVQEVDSRFKTSEMIEAGLLQDMTVEGFYFLPSVDSFGHDLEFDACWEGEDDTDYLGVQSDRIARLIVKAIDKKAKAFNTLGYFKKDLERKLIRLPYVRSLLDGLFVSKEGGQSG